MLITLKGGALLFAVLLSIISCVGIIEFYRMALPERSLEMWLAALTGSALLLTPFCPDPRSTAVLLGLLFLLFAMIFLFRIRSVATAAAEVSLAVLAFLYIPFLLMHLVMIRRTEFGIQWLLVIMLIVMTGDTVAYYTGSAFGKHKLYPQVSPKKSIEGSLGGLCGSLCGTLLAKFTFFPRLSLTDAVITALLIGIAGQAGDLFESLLKRSFGVKDSGTIFPGHGGVLDRLDSILFAAPLTYYYAIYIFRG